MSHLPCMGEWGIVPSFAALLIAPQAHAFYNNKTMVNNINNFGIINFYENKAATQEPSNKKEPVCEDIEPCEKVSDPPKFFCVSEKFPEQNIRERLAAELSHAATKREYCRSLYQLQHIGCINIDQYASDAKRAEVFNEYQSTFKLSASDFCKARATQYAQKKA